MSHPTCFANGNRAHSTQWIMRIGGPPQPILSWFHKENSLPLPGIQTQTSSLQPVTIVTELYSLLTSIWNNKRMKVTATLESCSSSSPTFAARISAEVATSASFSQCWHWPISTSNCLRPCSKSVRETSLSSVSFFRASYSSVTPA